MYNKSVLARVFGFVKRSKLESGIELTDCDNSVYMMINQMNQFMPTY